MHIGVPLETQTGETRVAATPETIKKLIGQGHKVTVQSGAGINASVVDSAYEAAGAIIGSANDAFGAELILKVVAPSDSELTLIKSGTVVVGMLNPFSMKPSPRWPSAALPRSRWKRHHVLPAPRAWLSLIHI